MNKSIIAATVASLVSVPSLSFAQSSSDVETMVVTANRFEQAESSAFEPISVVTREDIEVSQANSLTDIIKRLPGVEVAQNGGRGHNASVYIRGTNSDHVLILVDGIRIDSAAGGVALNKYPIGLVERVEVIRGPVAAKYGSDAIGGVINIITRSNRGNERKQVTVGIGSNSQKESNFSVKTDVNENGHLQIAAGYEETDGYDIKDDDSSIDYGFDSKNGMVGYEHIFNDHVTFYGSATWFDSLVEYDSYGLNYGSSENESFTGLIEYKNEQLNSRISLNHQLTENADYSLGETKDTASTFAEITMTQLQWANQYQYSDQVTISGGIEGRRESLGDDAISYGYAHSLAGESRDTTGIFLSSSFIEGDWGMEASLRHDKHDEYDSYTTWSLAAGYQIDDNHRIRASYGTAFKAPTYTDLTTTPDLKEETSDNIEIGVSGDYSFFNWNLAAYKNDVKNLIIWYQYPEYNWYSDNVDAEIKGAELDVSFATGPVYHTFVAEYKDHEDANNVQLARRAKENFKWIGFVSLGQFDIETTYIYTGKRLNLPTPQPDADDYIEPSNLWDLSVSYWVSDDFVLRGKVNNVFNEQYETAIGYAAPDREYYVNATYEF